MTNALEQHAGDGQAQKSRNTGAALKEWLASPACKCTLLVIASAVIIFVLFFFVQHLIGIRNGFYGGIALDGFAHLFGNGVAC